MGHSSSSQQHQSIDGSHTRSRCHDIFPRHVSNLAIFVGTFALIAVVVVGLFPWLYTNGPLGPYAPNHPVYTYAQVQMKFGQNFTCGNGTAYATAIQTQTATFMNMTTSNLAVTTLNYTSSTAVAQMVFTAINGNATALAVQYIAFSAIAGSGLLLLPIYNVAIGPATFATLGTCYTQLCGTLNGCP